MSSEPSGLETAPRDLEPSPFDLLNVLLKRWRLVLGLPVGLFVLVIGGTLVWPRSYTTTAAFMPVATTKNLAAFSGIAAQLGLTLPGQDPGQSPEFYADLVTSDELLRQAVDSTYAFSKHGMPIKTDLVSLWGDGRDSASARRQEAVSRLRRALDVSINPKTGVVRLTIRTRSPELSQQLVQRLLDLVNWFNLRKRQSQGSQEASFVGSRVTEAKRDLREHEDALQEFLQRNRQYRSSAQLQFEYDRLEREVNLRQQTLTQLSQALEMARIDEVRNTPVITIVENPIKPPEPDRRHLLLRGLLALLGGFVLGLFGALGGETLDRLARTSPEASEETRRLVRELIAELRRKAHFARHPEA